MSPYESLTNFLVPKVEHAYGTRATTLCALGTSAGRYPAELDLSTKAGRVVPTMTATLAYPGFLYRDLLQVSISCERSMRRSDLESIGLYLRRIRVAQGRI